MDKSQHDNEQSILGLASLSDEIKAARDLISTEEAARIINAFQCIPGLEAHYGRMEQRIQNVSKKESDEMAKSIYLEAYAHAQLSQDSPAHRSMPLTSGRVTDEVMTYLLRKIDQCLKSSHRKTLDLCSFYPLLFYFV